MERKTIGGFIAALRRANGMTQRELAERLNVSDKTVSRWERDESAPELAAIPVIAEIFGVSCDELLRGERRPPEERGGPEAVTQRGERERRRLIALSLSRFRARTYIAAGVAAAGLLAAMVCNLALSRAYIGFFAGAALYLAAAVAEAALLSTARPELEEGDEARRLGWELTTLAERAFALIAALLGFTLPLILTPGGAHAGLNTLPWLRFGAAGALLALAIAAAACWLINGSLVKRGVCSPGEAEEPRYRRAHALRKNCALGLIAALALTLLVQVFLAEALPGLLARGDALVFEDYESFVAYMETPSGGPRTAEALEDANGFVVCSYLHMNGHVAWISYTPRDGSVLPIRVITCDALDAANALAYPLAYLCFALYPLELLAAALLYRKKLSLV